VRSALYTWRQGARVSWLSLKTKVDGLSVVLTQNHWNGFLRFCLKTGGEGFLVEPQNQGGVGFPCLVLKTGSYGLVICASKSPRRFLDLELKIKQSLVCRLRHKTDEGMRRRRTRVEIYRLASRGSKSG
jgi:hypothetical protein